MTHALDALGGLYPLVVCDVGFPIEDARSAHLHREALIAADSVILVLGAREPQLHAGLRQLDIILTELGIPSERLRIIVNAVGGPSRREKGSITATIAEHLAERDLTVDAWLPWDARGLRRSEQHGKPIALARRRSAFARALTWPAGRAVPALNEPARQATQAPPRRTPRQHPERRARGSGLATMSTPDTTTNGDAAETIRQRVEHALTAEQVDLTSQAGRERTLQLIDQEISTYHAQALSGADGHLSEHDRAALARALRDDLVGLGAIAERMLSDDDAQEWMVNSPKRVFRDTGSASKACPTSSSKTTAKSARSSNASSSRSRASALTASPPGSRRGYPTAPGSPPRSRPSPQTDT